MPLSSRASRSRTAAHSPTRTSRSRAFTRCCACAVALDCNKLHPLSSAVWCQLVPRSGLVFKSRSSAQLHPLSCALPSKAALLGTSRLLKKRFRNWRRKSCKSWKTLFSILTLAHQRRSSREGVLPSPRTALRRRWATRVLPSRTTCCSSQKTSWWWPSSEPHTRYPRWEEPAKGSVWDA